MAAITKVGIPSVSSVDIDQNATIAGNMRAGEDLAAADACYIKNDGLVWKATGAAANAAAKVRGFAAEACKTGEAVTLFRDATWRYGAGLTPGADVFLSGTTAGGLDTAASTGGTAPIGYVVDATRIRLYQSRY